MKLRPVVIAVFSVLTALVIAAGVFLGLRTRNQYQDLLDQREELRADIAEIQSDISGFDADLDDTLSMKRTIDSLQSVTEVTRLNYQEIMTNRGTLPRTPRVTFSDSVVTDSWVEHRFVLTVEGKPEAVDSFLTATQANLPTMHVDTVEGTLRMNNLKLNAVGSIKFPVD